MAKLTQLWLFRLNSFIERWAAPTPPPPPRSISKNAPLSTKGEEGDESSGPTKAQLRALPAIILKGHKTLIAKKALRSLSTLSSHLLAFNLIIRIS